MTMTLIGILPQTPPLPPKHPALKLDHKPKLKYRWNKHCVICAKEPENFQAMTIYNFADDSLKGKGLDLPEQVNCTLFDIHWSSGHLTRMLPTKEHPGNDVLAQRTRFWRFYKLFQCSDRAMLATAESLFRVRNRAFFERQERQRKGRQCLSQFQKIESRTRALRKKRNKIIGELRDMQSELSRLSAEGVRMIDEFRDFL